MAVDPIEDNYEREKRDCPHCGGVIVEPRSSKYWNCAQCARRFTESEL